MRIPTVAMCEGGGDGKKKEKVYLPEPPIPKNAVDPQLATFSSVITSDRGLSDAMETSAEVNTSVSKTTSRAARAAAAHNTWLQSVISSATDISASHPFANAAAAADVTQQPPSRRVEEWRFTDLRKLFAARYAPALKADALSAVASNIDARRHISDGAAATLVFVDGLYCAAYCLFDDAAMAELTAAGGFAGAFGDYKGDVEQIVEMFARDELSGAAAPKGANGMFPALNSAIARDAAVIDIPAEFSMAKPIVVIHATSGGVDAQNARASAPRAAIRAGDRASVKVLEWHESAGGPHSLVLSCAAVDLAPNSKVRHTVASNLADDAHVIFNVYAEVRKEASYHFVPMLIGAQMSRVSATVRLVENGAHGEILGASVTDGYRVSDLHSRIVHIAKHTTSKQLQRNIASGHGRTVFRGRIIVPPGGDHTETSQLCRSLLLSQKAQVDAMPVLEVATDDVKATHGATVSDLLPDEVFYCQSRGIHVDKARLLLVMGFVKQVISDFDMPVLSEMVEATCHRVASEYKELKQRKLELSSI